jgi:hypothetical protein
MASHSNILYFDPCSEITLSYDGKEFIRDATVLKNSFLASRVLYDDMISHSFKVPKESSKEEINSLVELKMYEEAGLDLQKEYKLTHVVKELEFDDMLLIESFAIEKTTTQKRVEKVLESTNYIDFLAIPFLSFSTLYKNKIIAPKNDVFVYIEENEAFLTIYKDGYFLSTKSLMNFNDMIKSLQKNAIEIDLDSLCEILATKGLDASSYVEGESDLFNALENIFAELFTKINNVIIHSRSIFGFEKIDRLFFSTHFGRIRGLKETSLNFFSSDLRLMDFNLFKQKVQENFFERILASYAFDIAQKEPLEHDITFFKKEPPFLKTRAGQFLLFTLCFFLLIALYPAYLVYDISSLKTQEMLLSKQVNTINKNTKKIRNRIKNVQNEIALLDKEVKTQENRKQKITTSIKEIYHLKSNQQEVTDFFVKVNNLLAKYSLYTRSIELKDIHTMKIEVYTSFETRDKIAKFMKDLLVLGFTDVNTKEIKLNDRYYISLVEISR